MNKMNKMNKVAFILTAININDQERIGLNYYTQQNREGAFEFEIQDDQNPVQLIEEKLSELTGYNSKIDSITFQGTFFSDMNQENKTLLYSVVVDKTKQKTHEDEFGTQAKSELRWLKPLSASDVSDWRVPLIIMKILTSKSAQIITE